MITQSLIATFYITWGTILLLNYLPQLNASEISTHSSIIIQASKQKHQFLSRQLRSKLSSNGTFKSSNQPLNPTQYQQCVTDLSLADANGDAQLDKPEFISFLSLNSAYYGYEWGYASNQVSFSELPLEFPMLFHSTACMCAYEQQPGVDFGCCEGDNGHILVYGEEDVSSMTPEQEAYTRLFCTEAFYSYSVTFSPTKSPTFRPSDNPTVSPSTPQPTTSLMPTISMMPTISQVPSEARPTDSPVAVVTTMEPTTMAPTTAPSPAPMITAPVKPPTTSPTKKASTSVPTTSPMKGAIALPTSSPVVALTKSPTASPNAQPITSRPTTSSPVSTPGPPTSSPISSATGTPTKSPTSSSPTNKSPISSSPNTSPTTLSPTKSPISSILEIEISYGISSNCNMTAIDVLNGNYGITIKEGLVSATEAVVVDTLNTTYPRDGTNIGAWTRTVNGDAPKAMMYAPGVGARVRVGGLPVNEDDAMIEHANSASSASASSSHQKENPKAMVYAPGVGVRVRVEGLPHGQGATRRRLAILPGKDQLHTSLNNHAQGHHQPHLQPHQLQQEQQQQRTTNQQQQRRSLVYYTPDNPIIITGAQDVACQPNINCMRITSTVYLQLEEGDDADEIESVVFNGIQATIEDGSFFQEIPQETIFCPPSTTKPTSSPTISPVAVPTTPSPTTTPPTSAPPTSNAPTLSPIRVVVEEPTSTAPTGTPTDAYPTWIPTTQFPSSSPSEATSGGFIEPMEVTITYDLSNDCGLTADAIMNEEDNTLKEGLVAATTTNTIVILNQTFPRVENEEPTRRNVRARHGQRGLAHIDTTPTATSSVSSNNNNSNSSHVQHRNLVYYTDEYPVTINRILDVETGCAVGENCLLVISAITVVLEPGDDPAAVNAAIVSGMQDSFNDGSFFGAIPADTVICPT